MAPFDCSGCARRFLPDEPVFFDAYHVPLCVGCILTTYGRYLKQVKDALQDPPLFDPAKEIS